MKKNSSEVKYFWRPCPYPCWGSPCYAMCKQIFIIFNWAPPKHAGCILVSLALTAASVIMRRAETKLYLYDTHGTLASGFLSKLIKINKWKNTCNSLKCFWTFQGLCQTHTSWSLGHRIILFPGFQEVCQGSCRGCPPKSQTICLRLLTISFCGVEAAGSPVTKPNCPGPLCP